MKSVTLVVRIGRLVVDARHSEGLTADGIADAVRSALSFKLGRRDTVAYRPIGRTKIVGDAIAASLSERIGPVPGATGDGGENGVR